jgi:hypothetical protein
VKFERVENVLWCVEKRAISSSRLGYFFEQLSSGAHSLTLATRESESFFWLITHTLTQSERTKEKEMDEIEELENSDSSSLTAANDTHHPPLGN